MNNLYFPVFGFGEPTDVVCRKWLIMAENSEDALERGREFLESLKNQNLNVLPYYYPNEWHGPLVEMKRISEAGDDEVSKGVYLL
jgi:hypothetical protein